MMTDKHLPTARVLFKNIFPKVLFFHVNVRSSYKILANLFREITFKVNLLSNVFPLTQENIYYIQGPH